MDTSTRTAPARRPRTAGRSREGDDAASASASASRGEPPAAPQDAPAAAPRPSPLEDLRFSGLDRSAVGVLGEDIAAAHLSGRGWEVVDRNFRVARGELDIVARDGQTLVFVEVKTRRTLLTGVPQAAVTPEKLRRLRLLAGHYLLHRSPPHRDLRIDVIAVLLCDGEEPAIEHLMGVRE